VSGRTFYPHTTDGALQAVDEKFDGHMSLQQEAFLQPGEHEVSKKHGKLRTKFDRLALAMHLLSELCKAFSAARVQVDFSMEGAPHL
jgi:hypothetical protein